MDCRLNLRKSALDRILYGPASFSMAEKRQFSKVPFSSKRSISRRLLLALPAIFVVGVLTFLTPKPALAREGILGSSAIKSIRFCNRRPDTIYAIYGAKPKSGGNYTKGYYKVLSGDCRTINTGYNGSYLWASNEYGVNGGAHFCIRSGDAFTIENQGNSYRDTQNGIGWNTCQGLGNNNKYRWVKLGRSPVLVKREEIYRNPFHTSVYYYKRLCTLFFDAGNSVRWECDRWQRTGKE